MSEDHFCPICGVPVTPSARYPRYVCERCAEKAVAPDGRPLRFFNLSFSGGYGAEYIATGEPYEGSLCYIDEIQCIAGEAHMGGIVIQVAG